MSKPPNVRWSALQILKRVEQENANTSALLPLYEEQSAPKDRGLLHELTLGVLRRKLYLDRLISSLTGKNPDKFDIEVLIALRLGIYQLKFLDRIPDSAAVNESVKLVQMAKKSSAKGLVNAVLRKAASGKTVDVVVELTDKIECLSIETSHPRWLVEKWADQFGFEEARAICIANNIPAKACFRLTGKNDRQAVQLIESSGVLYERSQITETGFVTSRSNEKLRSLADAGLIYFQDEVSQLIGGLIKLSAKELFLDVCAAPGGKTTLIAADNPENTIVAGDKHLKRVFHLKDLAHVLGTSNICAVSYDAGRGLPFMEGTFDSILVDAPCSGTGTIRSNPEIRYKLSEKDISQLAEKQSVILANAFRALKRNGRLFYSTCSLEPEENEHVMEIFLREHPDAELTDLKVDKRFLTKGGFARFYPHRDGSDGFFIASVRKA